MIINIIFLLLLLKLRKSGNSIIVRGHSFGYRSFCDFFIVSIFWKLIREIPYRFLVNDVN